MTKRILAVLIVIGMVMNVPVKVEATNTDLLLNSNSGSEITPGNPTTNEATIATQEYVEVCYNTLPPINITIPPPIDLPEAPPSDDSGGDGSDVPGDDSGDTQPGDGGSTTPPEDSIQEIPGTDGPCTDEPTCPDDPAADPDDSSSSPTEPPQEDVITEPRIYGWPTEPYVSVNDEDIVIYDPNNMSIAVIYDDGSMIIMYPEGTVFGDPDGNGEFMFPDGTLVPIDPSDIFGPGGSLNIPEYPPEPNPDDGEVWIGGIVSFPYGNADGTLPPGTIILPDGTVVFPVCGHEDDPDHQHCEDCFAVEDPVDGSVDFPGDDN